MQRIKTETGTVYELNDGIVTIRPKYGYPYSFKLWVSKVADPGPIPLPWAEDAGELWVESSQPFVGKRWYVAGKDEWRISSSVVSIEESELGVPID